MNESEIRNVERIFKALANQRRLRIVRWLYEDPPLSVGDLAKKLKLSFKSTSKHLAILKAAHIVEAEQTSLVMNYRLSQPVHSITKLLLK